MTHGLAQWLTRAEAIKARGGGNRASGTGYEFGMISDAPSPWVPSLLEWLMVYVHKEKPINAGDRFPFRFRSLEPGSEVWAIGTPEPGDPAPVDNAAALVFWRYLSPFGTFTTSRGSFELRVATTITSAEWKLAKDTSSCHLLLLLHWAGIGQRTLPGRRCDRSHEGSEQAWAESDNLGFEDVKARLRMIWQRPGR